MKRLNENDIRYILKESKVILMENTSVSAAYRKYFSNISKDVYERLVKADPTYNERKPDVMGKYGLWILNQYRKGNVSGEYYSYDDGKFGLSDLNSFLSTFTVFINRIQDRNIQSYSNPAELVRVIQPFMDDPMQAKSKRDAEFRIRKDAKKVYEDNDWVVIVPKTWEASKVYGAGTSWCTKLQDSSRYFDSYSAKSDLNIVIDKKDRSNKYQLFLPAENKNRWEFKGKDDYEVQKPITYLHFSNGLIRFFDSITDGGFTNVYIKNMKVLDNGAMVYSDEDGNTVLSLNGKDINLGPNIEDVDDMFTDDTIIILKKNGYANYLNTEGVWMTDRFFKRVDSNVSTNIIVSEDGKYNYITSNMTLNYEWTDNEMIPVAGSVFIGVKDGKKYLIDGKENSLLETDIDGVVRSTATGVSVLMVVQKKGKRNVLESFGTDKEYKLSEWVDDISLITDEVFLVTENGKMNFWTYRTHGFITDEWFDEVERIRSCHYNMSMYQVMVGGKYGLVVQNWDKMSIAASGFDEKIIPINGGGSEDISTDLKILYFKSGDHRYVTTEEGHTVELKDKDVKVYNYSKKNNIYMCYAERDGEVVRNVIKEDGSFISDEWYKRMNDNTYGFPNAVLLVMSFENGMWNLLDINGNELVDFWFRGFGPGSDSAWVVNRNDKYNLIDGNGSLLLDKWQDAIINVKKEKCWNASFMMIFNESGTKCIRFYDDEGNPVSEPEEFDEFSKNLPSKGYEDMYHFLMDAIKTK